MRHPVIVQRVCTFCAGQPHSIGWKLWWDRGPWLTISHGVCKSADAKMEAWAQQEDEKPRVTLSNHYLEDV